MGLFGNFARGAINLLDGDPATKFRQPFEEAPDNWRPSGLFGRGAPGLFRAIANTVDGDPGTTFMNGMARTPTAVDHNIQRADLPGPAAPMSYSTDIDQLLAGAPLLSQRVGNAQGLPGQGQYADAPRLPAQSDGRGVLAHFQDRAAEFLGKALPPRLDGRPTAHPFRDTIGLLGGALKDYASEGPSNYVADWRHDRDARELAAEVAATGRPGSHLEFDNSGAHTVQDRPYDPRAIAPLLMRAQAAGVNVAPYASLAGIGQEAGDRDAYLDSLPIAARAGARLDPKGYAAWDRTASLPEILNTSEGAVSFDRRTGKVRDKYLTERRPPAGWQVGPDGGLQPQRNGPADPEYIQRAAEARARERAAPQLTTSVVLGRIYDKLANGGALTPGEQRIYDDHRSGGGSFLNGAGAGDDYGDEDAAAPPPRAATARVGAQPTPGRGGPVGALQRSAAPTLPQAAAPPAAALAQLKEGHNTAFANGQVWTLRGGQPQRVK